MEKYTSDCRQRWQSERWAIRTSVGDGLERVVACELCPGRGLENGDDLFAGVPPSIYGLFSRSSVTAVLERRHTLKLIVQINPCRGLVIGDSVESYHKVGRERLSGLCQFKLHLKATST